MDQQEKQQHLLKALQERFGEKLFQLTVGDMVTVELSPEYLLEVCKALHKEENFHFEQLTDLCGVDYLQYGTDNWRTQETPETGFSRGEELSPARVLTWHN